MAKLQDLKYDEEYVFSNEFREFLDECNINQRSRYCWPLIKAAEKLTDSELHWLWMDAIGAFECSHPEYEGPSDELLERAGSLVHFFTGYGLAMSELV